MSARVCAVCRAVLGQEHIAQCTVAKGIVIDAQCVDTMRESAILWVLLRLHQLEVAKFIAPVAKEGEQPLRLSERGLLYAIEYFSKNPPPSADAIVASCAWLLTTKMPGTPCEQIAGLTTLVLDWKPDA